MAGARRALRRWPAAHEAAHRAYAVARRAGFEVERRQPRRTMVDQWGITWVIEPWNALDRTLEAGVYHWAIPLVFGRLPTDAVAVDVGANAGYWSLPLATRCSDVLAYEPDPSMMAKLLANLALNPRLRVTVRPVALSDAPGQAHLTVRRELEGTLLNAGLSSLASTDLAERTIDVDARTLDEELASLGRSRVDFIKIDVEGWEAHVLRGAAGTIGRDRPVIFWEAALSIDRRLGSRNVADSLASLTDVGYRHEAVLDGPPLMTIASIADLEALGRDVDVLSTPV